MLHYKWASAAYCAGVAERSGGNDLPISQTSYINVALRYRMDLAMLAQTMKSETCFLKKVVSFKYGKTVSAKAIKLQYQMKTEESFRK